jgi:glycosyltransferase involved in cell wall biosynthesis
MRVLQIINSLGIGGAEVLLAGVAPRLRARGVTCDVVALLQTGNHLEGSLRAAGVTLHCTGAAKLRSPRHILPLAKLMREYDVVHVHLFPAQLWAALAAAMLRPRVPMVITEHGPWNRRRRWWFRPVDALMYYRYERIACISEITEKELTRWSPGASGKTLLIPNGIALEAFETAEAIELPYVPPGVPRLVFVGRFELEKDQATILRALQAIPAAHLLLVGDGPLRAQHEVMARSLGVSERVTFLGWRSDIPRILKASDIFIHSANVDGFGIAACEAMAAGLPVLASNIPGLAQVVEGAGVLFPVGDDATLSREITALLASATRRREMSAASRQRARQFSIERTVDGCIEMYQSVLRTSAQRNTEKQWAT